jgi:hypothetical protein
MTLCKPSQRLITSLAGFDDDRVSNLGRENLGQKLPKISPRRRVEALWVGKWATLVRVLKKWRNIFMATNS